MTADHFEDSWRVGCFAGFLVGREAGGIGRGGRCRCAGLVLAAPTTATALAAAAALALRIGQAVGADHFARRFAAGRFFGFALGRDRLAAFGLVAVFADRVAVMADGRITELDSHDRLVAANGEYATLWRHWHGG